MTDKEMLELAAKAAGVFMKKTEWPFESPLEVEFFQTTFDQNVLSITGFRVWYGFKGDIGGIEAYTWNPLTDDGDALRLAISLGFYVGLQSAEVWKDGKEWINIFEDGEDPYAATRRAITRAAAEIGKTMRQEVSSDLPEDNYYKDMAEAFSGNGGHQ